MVSLKIFNTVLEELKRVEKSHGVRILYACESGSRAWGFSSQDSDYDVRFLYVHSRDWYLSIDDHRDVIEEPIRGDLDISGWELRKALRLLRKSNAPLIEWLKSPVVYAQEDGFIRDFRALARGYYSPARCFKHYLHMAYGNARNYLKDDLIWRKKYLYVLRPLLACRWIEQGVGEPPMLFDALVDGSMLDPSLIDAIRALVSEKKQGKEQDRSPRIEILSDFIAVELLRLDTVVLPEEYSPDHCALNEFFRRFCDS